MEKKKPTFLKDLPIPRVPPPPPQVNPPYLGNLFQNPQINESDIIALVEMGYPRKNAIESLQKYPGDLDRAAADLTDNHAVFLAPAIKQEEPVLHHIIPLNGDPPAKQDAPAPIPAPEPVQAPAPIQKKELPRLKSYAKLRNNLKNCDLLILVGKSQVEKHVHKFVLANCSAFFEKLLFAESSEKIIIDDLDPNEFEDFLDFCYTLEIHTKSPENILSLYKASLKYTMPEFTEYLTDYFSKNLTEKNVFKMFQMTDNQELIQLHDITTKYLCDNAKEIFKEGNILNELSKENVMKILKLPLKTFEITIMARTLDFINANTDKNKSKKENRAAMEDLLKLIQLEKLGAAGIQMALTSGMFKKEFLLQIAINNSRNNLAHV